MISFHVLNYFNCFNKNWIVEMLEMSITMLGLKDRFFYEIEPNIANEMIKHIRMQLYDMIKLDYNMMISMIYDLMRYVDKC